jgi:type II secretory ATPase GspE/PulE/Tfp pilus assembly ATPase PilB-like protein
LISKLNTPERNIITIEEPVEYLVDGLTQIEVKSDIGLNFATGCVLFCASRRMW